MPDIPPPEECLPVMLWSDDGDNLNRRIERRAPEGRYDLKNRKGEISEDGRMQMWLRTVEDVPVARIAPETEAVGESGSVVAAASGTDTATVLSRRCRRHGSAPALSRRGHRTGRTAE